MKRREFAKRAAAAAVVAPLAWPARGKPVAWRGLAQQSETPKATPKLTLSPKQEEDVKKATDRREDQLSAMRSRTLPYDLEPAFVFAARPKTRKKR